MSDHNPTVDPLGGVQFTCTECFCGFVGSPGSTSCELTCPACRSSAEKREPPARKERDVSLYVPQILFGLGVVISATVVAPMAYRDSGLLMSIAVFFPGIIVSAIAAYFALLPIGVTAWLFWYCFYGCHKEVQGEAE
jgi:hypothetical protein